MLAKHELRNPLPADGRNIELLVYGIFSAFEEDQGYHSTAWVELSDVLMSIERQVVASKLA
eukprot:2622915-Prymnesium_polylepis.1